MFEKFRNQIPIFDSIRIRSSNRSLIYKYSDTRVTSASTSNRSRVYIYIYIDTEFRGEFFETRRKIIRVLRLNRVYAYTRVISI